MSVSKENKRKSRTMHIRRLHENGKLVSGPDIAKEMHVTSSTIRKWRRDLNIKPKYRIRETYFTLDQAEQIRNYGSSNRDERQKILSGFGPEFESISEAWRGDGLRDGDQLMIAEPIGCLTIFGIFLIILCVMAIIIGFSRNILIASLRYILIASSALLLRRIHIIDRRALTANTYVGFWIPFRGLLPTPILWSSRSKRSIKNIKRVSVRYVRHHWFDAVYGSGGVEHRYYVGFGQDKWLASYGSLVVANKKKSQIERFLRGKTGADK